MRSYSLLIILICGLSTTAQFAGNEEIEVRDLIEIEDAEAEAIEVEETVDRIDFTRGIFLNADTLYKQEYTGEEYTYREPKEYKPKEPAPTPDRPNLNIGPLIGFIFKALLVLVAIAGLYFLYLSLSNLRLKRGTHKNRVVSTREQEKDLSDPEELDDDSLEALLNKAIAEENKILAIRYYFLMYLKKLQDVEVIAYHRDKTNAEYLSEIESPQLSEQFVKLSYIYEYAWYGKKVISDEVFSSVEQTFKHQIGTVK